MADNGVKKKEVLQKKETTKRSFTVNGEMKMDTRCADNDGEMELVMEVEPEKAKIAGFELFIEAG